MTQKVHHTQSGLIRTPRKLTGFPTGLEGWETLTGEQKVGNISVKGSKDQGGDDGQ